MAEKKPKPELPLSLRAGNIQPMEGMAAPKPPEYYVTDYAYIGYPLIHGQRIFVVADGGEVKYQDEKEAIPTPDAKIDEAFAALHEEVGSYILEGMVVYLQTDGKTYKSGHKEGEVENGGNGYVDQPVQVELHIYRALYLKNDLRQLAEDYRNMVAGTLVKLIDYEAIRIVKAIYSERDKFILADHPAIWFLRDAQYRVGLDEKRQPMVYSALF